MRLPSGLKAALFTPPVCPFKVLICLPLLASQIRTVLSLEAVTMRPAVRAEGGAAHTAGCDIYAPAVRAEGGVCSRRSVYPFRSLICWPLSASQMRAVSSLEAVTMRLPSGLKAALFHFVLYVPLRSLSVCRC